MYKKLRTALNKDTLKFSRSSFVLTDSTDNVLTYLEPKTAKRTRDHLKTNAKVSRSRSRKSTRRSLRYKKNGSRIKLNLLLSKSRKETLIVTTTTCLLKNQFLIRKSWDLTTKLNPTTRGSEILKLLLKTRRLRWTSWMTCSTATLILKTS